MDMFHAETGGRAMRALEAQPIDSKHHLGARGTAAVSNILSLNREIAPALLPERFSE